MSGASGWEGMEDYGKSKQQWLQQFLELPKGIPSDDTFRRLFERLDPHQFQQGFQSWVSSLAELLGATVVFTGRIPTKSLPYEVVELMETA